VLGFLLVAGWIFPFAANATNYGQIRAIAAEAELQISPPEIRLNWPSRSDLDSYEIKRIDSYGLSATSSLPGSATGFVDTSVIVGEAYEYQLSARLTNTNYTANCVLSAGINLPLTEDRGVTLLIVDSTIANPLAAEISRLEADLLGDGWQVETHQINPATSTPPDVRNLIIARHASAELAGVRSVLLLGKIPVPYSGNHSPDAHTAHRGAWPADAYYGDIDGIWTDSSVTNSGASRPANHNIPGDGKFDQSALPSNVDLMVGRIDLSNLPSFAPMTEVDLLRRYLDKNHAYRHAQSPIATDTVIDDHLAHFSEGFSAPPRAALGAILGCSKVKNGDWLTTTTTQTQLFGIGVGGGTYSSVNGVATTAQTAAQSPSVYFSLLFGSYFGDWDNSDNFLRAQLATPSGGLASMYSGRPIWQVHALGHGKTFGHVARLTQNAVNKSPYATGYSSRRTHLGLMGDPTLRLFPVAPPENLTATLAPNGDTTLSWTFNSSLQGFIGYHVYRKTPDSNSLERLTLAPITTDHFTDSASIPGSNYCVKTIVLQQTASSSFQNGSQAAVVATPEPLTFETWLIEHFGSTPTTANADPDNDDLPNLLEYALGSDPTLAGSGLVLEALDGDNMQFTHTRNPFAPDVSLQLQVSIDLQNWTQQTSDISTSPESLPGSGIETINVTVKRTPGAPRKFVRLHAQRIN